MQRLLSDANFIDIAFEVIESPIGTYINASIANAMQRYNCGHVIGVITWVIMVGVIGVGNIGVAVGATEEPIRNSYVCKQAVPV